ncbi:MAG: M23 family metallopeptidase [Streptomycetales bacterium]
MGIETIPLNRQVIALRADASKLAQRASRAQHRITLDQKREAVHQRALADQMRAEALRPKFAMPISHYELSSGYGEVSGLWVSAHTGQDFAAPTGTPVSAAADGVITEAGWAGAYGYRIVVEHPDGSETWYCHLSAISRSSGDVLAGDMIGRVGNSGNTTGSHLHFEVRIGGAPIDPLGWLSEHGLDY